jgi:phage head maturation protease
VDEKGVNFEFEAPKCDIGDRCLEMVRRGDYSGCSFEFWPEDYDVEEREGGKDVKITHKKFRALTALTIGMDPAYKQTSVNARELYDETPAGKKAKADAEAEAKEIMKREMCRRAEHLQRLSNFDEIIESTTY